MSQNSEGMTKLFVELLPLPLRYLGKLSRKDTPIQNKMTKSASRLLVLVFRKHHHKTDLAATETWLSSYCGSVVAIKRLLLVLTCSETTYSCYFWSFVSTPPWRGRIGNVQPLPFSQNAREFCPSFAVYSSSTQSFVTQRSVPGSIIVSWSAFL